MKKKSKIAFGRLDLLRNDTLNNKNKIRIGFIGGGPNSFICLLYTSDAADE